MDTLEGMSNVLKSMDHSVKTSMFREQVNSFLLHVYLTAFAVLGIKSRASCITVKCSTTKLLP
jgi:heme/copper-type cytochrome/quinol oxidase subunit 4